MERQPLTKFKELEALILRMGYSKESVEQVIALLESQSMTSHFDADAGQALGELKNFVKRVLKPAYVAKTLNQPLALVDIRVEAIENHIYFIKHLFHPFYRDGRMKIRYAYMECVATNRYNLAYRKDDGSYEISHHQISLEDAMTILQAHPLYTP